MPGSLNAAQQNLGMTREEGRETRGPIKKEAKGRIKGMEVRGKKKKESSALAYRREIAQLTKQR